MTAQGFDDSLLIEGLLRIETGYENTQNMQKRNETEVSWSPGYLASSSMTGVTVPEYCE